MLARLSATLLVALLCACSSLTPSASPTPLASPPQFEDPNDFGTDIEGTDVRVGAEFGQREYTSSSWGRIDSHSVFGLTGSHEPPEWPVGVDLGLFCSGTNGTLGTTRLDLVTWEGFVGAMKSASLFDGRLILHGGVGAGVSYLVTDPDDTLQSSEDASWTSGYARAGFTVHISPNFELGLTVRSARGGSFDVAGVGLDGDYDQVGFVLSGSW